MTAPAARAAPEPAPRTVAAEPTPVEDTATLPPVETIAPVAAVAVPPVETTAPAPVRADDNAGILALILGGLAFLALAIWGFVAIGRRKPVRRYAAEIVPNSVPAVPAPVVIDRTPVAPEPVQAAPRTVTPLSPSPLAARSAQVAGALPHAGASVALPARMPENYAERDELMKRMIAAKPDRANPFTDRGARTRRARLILQSLGRDFGETDPWIDLSQYPNNWPELADKRSVAA